MTYLCEIKKWRTPDVLCCQNGSAVSGRHDNWIWVEEKPLICGPIEWAQVTESASVATLLVVVGGTIVCIGFHLFYLGAYLFYRIVHPLW